MLRTVQGEGLNCINPGMNQHEVKKVLESFRSSDPTACHHITHYYIHGVGLKIHKEPVTFGYVAEPMPLDRLCGELE